MDEPEIGPEVRRLFTVQGELGRGGQSAVWRVRPKGGARDYALKYVDAAGDQYNREQELASLLVHPNIVELYTTGLDSGRAYAVYEIVEGRTLEALCAARELTIAETVEIMHQVLAGLAHSHAAGVVHRDIKPPNVLITRDGVAKIADFGIGRLVGASARLSPDFTVPFMGTPGYAAPEQIRGRGVLLQTDVYACGVLFFKVLTGVLPYPATTVNEMLRMQCETEAEDPKARRPDLPKGVATLISACLARDPAARPRDARAVLERLKREALAAGLPAPLEPEPVAIASVPLGSADGLAAAGPACAASAVLLAAPLFMYGALVGAPERATLGVALTFWAAWLPAMAAATARLGRLGEDPLEKLLGVAALVIAAGAVRMSDGARVAATIPFALACHLVAAWLLFGRTAQVWIEQALTGPGEVRRLAGLSTLELVGPAGARAALDGGPETPLPARLVVPAGAHRLTVTLGRGAPRTFPFVLPAPGGWLARFTAAGDGAVQVRGAERAAAARAPLGAVAAGLALALGLTGAAVVHRIVRPTTQASAAPEPDVPSRPAAQAALKKANDLRAQKWWGKAAAEAHRSLDLEPSFAARVFLVRLLADQGQLSAALDEADKLKTRMGSDPARLKALEDALK